MDSQVFVGSPSVTIWYPRRGQPRQYDAEKREWTQDDANVDRLLSGDPQAQPVLLALLRRNGKDSLRLLAIYGLAKVAERSPATVEALKSVPADDTIAQEIILAAAQREPVQIPIKVFKENSSEGK
jgi:hypothetical protein